MKNRQKHYINISELSKIDEAKLFYTDIYPSDIFSEKLTTRLFDAVIHDELLYEALLSIKIRTLYVFLPVNSFNCLAISLTLFLYLLLLISPSCHALFKL